MGGNRYMDFRLFTIISFLSLFLFCFHSAYVFNKVEVKLNEIELRVDRIITKGQLWIS